MPKYKIDPIPGLPSWFVPGIVCRVRDTEDEAWREPRHLVGFLLQGDYRFIDERQEFFRFAEPVEQWEPQEGEWVAVWDKESTRFGIGVFKLLGNKCFIVDGYAYAHVARLQYPDGCVIDCACSVEELKQRTEWI